MIDKYRILQKMQDTKGSLYSDHKNKNNNNIINKHKRAGVLTTKHTIVNIKIKSTIGTKLSILVLYGIYVKM